MGAAVILDLIGSVIIGGILLLTLFRMNDNASANTFNFSGELTVQENLVATIEVLEYDLRKIAYCDDWKLIPDPAVAILEADSTYIKFLSDANPDNGTGTVDTIEYVLGPSSELTGTPNPNDRMLYRYINGVGPGVNLGVTQFIMKYYDADGDLIAYSNPRLKTPPTGIMSMQIDVTVENTAAYNEQYRYCLLYTSRCV